MLSTSPEREDTILFQDPFSNFFLFLKTLFDFYLLIIVLYNFALSQKL